MVSSISFIGLFTISLKEKRLKEILLYLVSFSVGGLLGDAFIHILPASIEMNTSLSLSLFIMTGIIVSFIVEKFIHWRHCHVPTSKKHPHPFALMNLVGDGVHNFIDGLIIGSSFLTSFQVGIATTMAVALHEIPQEIGDFGVLMHGGFKRKKALFMNFVVSLTAVLGTVLSLVIGSFVSGVTIFLLPFTIGSFVYIASSDLIPELHKETEARKSLIQLIMMLAGIMMMLLVLLLE